jgi:hypothetical protein
LRCLEKPTTKRKAEIRNVTSHCHVDGISISVPIANRRHDVSIVIATWIITGAVLIATRRHIFVPVSAVATPIVTRRAIHVAIVEIDISVGTSIVATTSSIVATTSNIATHKTSKVTNSIKNGALPTNRWNDAILTT